jgi:hypothetical protein
MTLADIGALLNFLIVLAFLFLVLSLVASIAVEAFAALMGSRGRMLRKRILTMFDDPYEVGFAGKLLASPLIKSLGEKGRAPSYIPSELFAQSVLGIIVENRITDPRQLPPVLRQLALAEGFATPEERKAFGKKLVEWYDRAMERLSGKFRRRSKASLFVVGLVLAVGLNIDTITLTSQIWANRLTLDATVQEIAELHEDVVAKAGEGDPVETLEGDDDLKRRAFALFKDDKVLKSLEVPVGWAIRDEDCPPPDDDVFKEGGVYVNDKGEVLICTLEQRSAAMWEAFKRPADWPVLKIVGWLLTAFAILPGAKFWFDILGKALSLRATGPKPVTGEKQGSKGEKNGAGVESEGVSG